MNWSKVLSLRLMTFDLDFSAISVHFSTGSADASENMKGIMERIVRGSRILAADTRDEL